MKFRILILLALFGLCGIATGQTTFQPKQDSYDSKGIVYDKEITFDLQFLQTNGWSLAFNQGKLKTYYLTPYYHFGIGGLKHIKEYRQQSFDNAGISSIGDSQSYVFGKQNSLYVVRVGYGQKRYFSEKAKIRGLAVGVNYEMGPTLGLLKPYYLDLSYPDGSGDDTFRSEKYSEANHDVFLERLRIKGSSGFLRGFSELSFRPGVHAQASAHFDWGAYDEFVKAVEAGFMIDVFFGNTDLMVEIEGVENRPFFMNVFINLQLGKRR